MERINMNKTLKVAYIDFWPEWTKENFVYPILSKYYNVVEDNSKPDVIFHSIFNNMQGIKKYPRDIKRILILAENWRPARFDTDYSISFDPHTNTNYRLPLWQIYLLLWPELKDSLYNKVQHTDFERFGAFVVSNPHNFMRNSAFLSLSTYKQVHSYGKYQTNSQELQAYSKGTYWRDAKLSFFKNKPHKFMFAYENTPTKYYCTEKLMDAFLVGSIPIYWGDTAVGEEWNEKAFINATKLGSQWIDAVKKIDTDALAFESMYNEPIFTESQKNKLEENLEKFEEWLINITNK